MGRELTEAVLAADVDDAVRAIVVTGAGRGFCAGADLSAGEESFDAMNGRETSSFGAGHGRTAALFNSRKPIITAFNGPAIGVGLTMVLPTDIRIASTAARFGLPFTRLGLSPEAGCAWFLPQIVGLPQALRWCLSGASFGPDEALASGLVSEVIEPDRLLPRAREIALEIADNTAAVSVAVTRQLLWRFASATLPFDLLQTDTALAKALGSSSDVREGLSALREKRPPEFVGKVSVDMPSEYPWWT
jgi:enoyl-CoA hydratase/carnithine racemase